MSARLALNILLGAAIVACVAGAVALLVQDSRSSGDVVVTLPTATATGNAPGAAPALENSESGPIAVYVSGAVRMPGVYTLDADARAADALRAAGGPADDADLDAVNLAMRLGDEQQVHFPTSGSASMPASGDPSNRETGSRGATGKLNINTATAEEFETLPGIGERKAAAIVEHRGANGPFERVEDLVEVSGIGEGILASIRDLVVVR